MSALGNWIVQIGYLVLVAGLVEFLLPNNSARGAVRLVVGLVVILAIVEPVVRWVGDPAIFDRMTQSILADDGARYIEAGVTLSERSARDAAAAWEARLERQLEAMAALVDGVREVSVDVRTGGGGAVTGVEVAIRTEAEDRAAGAAGVRRIIEGFIPGIDPGAIVITDR